MIQESAPCLTYLGCDLCEPDECFNGLNLTEERTYAGEAMMSPVLKQTSSFGRNTSIIWVFQATPYVHLLTKLIYDRGGIVLLCLCGKPLPSSKISWSC